MRSLLVFVLLALPAALQAQRIATPDLAPGTHVRVKAPGLPGGRTEAAVWYIRSDTLHLLRSGQASSALPFAGIDKIEVRRNNSLLSLGGLIAGGVIGGVIGYNASYGNDRPGLSTGWHVAEVAGSAAVGGAIGGLVGSLFASPWRQVFPTR
jgi:hypothetical protein